MINTLSSTSKVRRPVQAALALLVGLTFAGTALATELKPPASKSKLLEDRDVTIIIIDENDRRPSSRVNAPAAKQPALPLPPASRASRDEDEFNIRILRDRSAGSRKIVRSGPKIIIVDKDSSGCDGGGVCVIRP